MVSRLSSTKCSCQKEDHGPISLPVLYQPTKTATHAQAVKQLWKWGIRSCSFPFSHPLSAGRRTGSMSTGVRPIATISATIPTRRVSTGQSTTEPTSKARYAPVVLADEETIPKADPLFSMNTTDILLQSQPTKEHRDSWAQNDVRHQRGNRRAV
jgi:hypothetical protein